MAYQSLEEIRQVCCEREIPFWRAVLLDDMNERTVSEEESVQTMEAMWDAMLRSSDSYDEKLVSSSGLAMAASAAIWALSLPPALPMPIWA